MDDDDIALLKRISSGAGVAEIAQDLGVSEHALNRRLIRIRRELDAPTTVAAVVTAIRRGIL